MMVSIDESGGGSLSRTPERQNLCACLAVKKMLDIISGGRRLIGTSVVERFRSRDRHLIAFRIGGGPVDRFESSLSTRSSKSSRSVLSDADSGGPEKAFSSVMHAVK